MRICQKKNKSVKFNNNTQPAETYVNSFDNLSKPILTKKYAGLARKSFKQQEQPTPAKILQRVLLALIGLD